MEVGVSHPRRRLLEIAHRRDAGVHAQAQEVLLGRERVAGRRPFAVAADVTCASISPGMTNAT